MVVHDQVALCAGIEPCAGGILLSRTDTSLPAAGELRFAPGCYPGLPLPGILAPWQGFCSQAALCHPAERLSPPARAGGYRVYW